MTRQNILLTKYERGVQLANELSEKIQALIDEYDAQFQVEYPGSYLLTQFDVVPTFDTDAPTDISQSYDTVQDGRDSCTYFYYRVGDMNIRERVKTW